MSAEGGGGDPSPSLGLPKHHTDLFTWHVSLELACPEWLAAGEPRSVESFIRSS